MGRKKGSTAAVPFLRIPTPLHFLLQPPLADCQRIAPSQSPAQGFVAQLIRSLLGNCILPNLATLRERQSDDVMAPWAFVPIGISEDGGGFCSSSRISPLSSVHQVSIDRDVLFMASEGLLASVRYLQLIMSSSIVLLKCPQNVRNEVCLMSTVAGDL